MKLAESTRYLSLTPSDNDRLAKLCGQFNQNLNVIERALGVEINNRGSEFEIIGSPVSTEKAHETLLQLYHQTENGKSLSVSQIQLLLKSVYSEQEPSSETTKQMLEDATIRLARCSVVPRTPNQRHYVKSIEEFDINFGIGPSGTGKTFLAVARAVAALEKEQISRIVLVRPAVEAGEKLGFLPGDMSQKVDPYLRPLYDALYEMLGATQTVKLIEKGVIEIAPLAFMRGRTLNDSFIILDEGQNTTQSQMKMFLTRIGFGSKAVITGDITQIDLPHNSESGLRHAISILHDIEQIKFTFFGAKDVVRHPIVQKIIEAYEYMEKSEPQS